MKENPGQFTFSKTRLQALPVPTRVVRYRDTECRGLQLKCTPAGSRKFIVRKGLPTGDVTVTLGEFPKMTVDNARREARIVLGQLESGINPNDEKRTSRNKLTFGEFFNASYMPMHARLQKKSWQEDLRRYNLNLKTFENRRLLSIDKAELEALHKKVAATRGKVAANRTLSLLGVVFSKAVEWGKLDVNPCKGIKKFPEKPRKRFLSPEEIKRFFVAVLEYEKQNVRDFLLLLLCTGQRRGKIQALTWEQVDFQNRILTIPDTKNSDTITVSLVGPALDILQARKGNGSKYVFPQEANAEKHIVSPKRSFKTICDRAKIKDFHLHDLRATLATWAAYQGANDFLLMQMLGHRDRRATQVYTREGQIEPVRLMQEAAVAKMYVTAGLLPAPEVSNEK